MHSANDASRMASSASALGAGLLGFGIGAIWGAKIDSTVLLVTLILGAIIHIFGMCVSQMKDMGKAGSIARILWISAWICLMALAAMFIYIVIR